MSLPPVEEVTGRENEKKSERSYRRGGGGSKQEWWVQNMKGKASKQRFSSNKGAVRLVKVNRKNGERDSKKHEIGSCSNKQTYMKKRTCVAVMPFLAKNGGKFGLKMA